MSTNETPNSQLVKSSGFVSNALVTELKDIQTVLEGLYREFPEYKERNQINIAVSEVETYDPNAADEIEDARQMLSSNAEAELAIIDNGNLSNFYLQNDNLGFFHLLYNNFMSLSNDIGVPSEEVGKAYLKSLNNLASESEIEDAYRLLENYYNLNVSDITQKNIIKSFEGYVVCIYKNTGEMEVVDITQDANRPISSNQNKDLVGMAYISKNMFDFGLDVKLGSISSTLVGIGLSELLKRVGLSVPKVEAAIKGLETAKDILMNFTAYLGMKIIKDGITKPVVDTVISKTVEDIAELEDLYNDFDAKGLLNDTDRAVSFAIKSTRATLSMLSSMIGPAGYPLAIVSLLLVGVDKMFSVENSMNMGAAGLQRYIEEGGVDGLMPYSQREEVIGSVGASGFNDLVGDGTVYNKLTGSSGENKLQVFGGNNNELYGMGGDDVLIGGSGIDYLYGGADKDILYGDGGSDTLDGGAGNDDLSGGIGTDTLDGGTGDDNFYYNKGDGHDTIIDEQLGGSQSLPNSHVNAGNDTLFLNGFKTTDLRRTRVGFDLILRFTNDSGTITIKNHYWPDASPIEYIKFDNIDTPTMLKDWLIELDDQDNTLSAGSNSNLIYAFDGVDTIEANAGNDVVYGNGGSDTIHGGIGNDVIYGGQGKDILCGDEDNDHITGGVETDLLFGGQGNDTYYFSKGDGKDFIYDSTGIDQTEKNTIFFDDTVILNDIYFETVGQSLIVYYGFFGRPDSIIIANYFSKTGQVLDTVHSINVGGVEHDIEVLRLQYEINIIEGTEGDDRRVVEDNSQTIQLGVDLTGIAGLRNQIIGKGGDDHLVGKELTDYLYGGDDNDLLYGNGGDDQLHGDGGIDTLYGGSGSNTLEGGAGNDTLYGGIDGDTYIYNFGDGSDIITDPEGIDNLILNLSLESIKDVSVDGQGTVTLSIGNSTITINNFYSVIDTNGSSSYVKDTGFIEKIIIREDKAVYILIIDPVNQSFDVTAVGGVFGSLLIEEMNALFDDLRKNFYAAEIKKSPLVLDLDNDGVETTLLNNGVQFDHNNNGFTEKSAWVSKDDGLLVFDRNGDGIIDSGKELFGDNTLLKDGTKAGNGFIALAELDTNQNGKIDALDDDFNLLKVWKDSNSNGLTDVGELYSLNEVNVDSISTAFTTSNTIDAQGNEHRQLGRYTQLDGTTSAIDDVWFQMDTMNTIGKEFLLETEAVSGLPDLSGFGNAYSLHQAMLRDDSGVLIDLVEQFVNEGDVLARKSLVTSIIYKWTGVENIDPDSRSATKIYGNVIGDARKLEALEVLLGEKYMGTWCWGEKDPNPHGQAAPLLLNAFEKLADFVYTGLVSQSHLKGLYSEVSLSWDKNSSMLKYDFTNVANEIILIIENDAMAGKEILRQFVLNLKQTKLYDTNSFETFRNAFVPFGDAYLRIIDIVDKIEVIGTVYNDNLNGSNANEALWGYDGNDTLNSLGGDDYLYGGAGGDTLTGGFGNDLLDGGLDNDRLMGGAGNDTYLFEKGYGQDVILDYDTAAVNYDRIVFSENILPDEVDVARIGLDLELSIRDTEDKLTIEDYFLDGSYRVESIMFSNGVTWDYDYMISLGNTITEGDDTIIGDETSNVISGLSGNDFIFGNEGDDSIQGGEGNDHLYGGMGNDTLDGGTGDDSLYGADSNLGDSGNDTYIFGRGYGQDTIYDYDTQPGSADRVIFKDDVLPEDISFSKVLNNLELRINGTEDKLVLVNYYVSRDFQIETFQFADGTIWTFDDLKEAPITGTDSDDILNGSEIIDTINAGAGNDTVNGLNGDDILYGEGGNDTLNAGSGNDTLNGGTGMDSLLGGFGNDTYQFARGYGVDTLFDFDKTIGNVDTVEFLEGVLPEDVHIIRNGVQLELQIVGTDDKLIINNYFVEENYRIEGVRFADGTTWDSLVINEKARRITGTSQGDILQGYEENEIILGLDGEDTLRGSAGDDTLDGGDGIDKLYGDEGDDTLNGGSGNDTLYGGTGNDTYQFGIGSGSDVIYEDDMTSGNHDIITILQGTNPDDILMTRTGKDLHVQIIGTNDKLTVNNYFERIWSEGAYVQSDRYQVEGIVFADGTTWDRLIINDKVRHVTGTSNGDVLQGYEDNDILLGLEGDDTLMGGTGSDTYILRRSDGHDRIIESYDESSVVETVWFKDISPNELQFSALNGSDDLVIRTADGSYQVTLENYFGGYHERVCFRFGENEAWTLEQTQALSLKPTVTGTSDDDVLRGTDYSNAVVMGGSGNDTLYASGHGELYGGGGNDELRGSGQGSILEGGAGTDKLISFGGQDIMVFARGGGRDIVHLSLDDAIDSDVIWFKDHVPGDIEFTADKFISDSLLIRAVDGSCEMVIANYFSAENPQILLKFGSDVALTANESLVLLNNLTLTGTEGDDWINGSSSIAMPLIGGGGNDRLIGEGLSEMLFGGTGNDNLDGGDGDDTLNGGAGDDVLVGGLGSDVFEFETLCGSDTIAFEGSRYSSDVETIWIKNMTSSEVVFSYDMENPANLILKNLDGTGRLTVENYFGGLSNYFQFRFKDAQALSIEESKALTNQVSITGGLGTDVLNANPYGATIISGGAGDDRLIGGAYNDVLDGGSGDDQLSGGYGSDTYVFGNANGRDRLLVESARNAEDIETVWFKGLTSSNIVFAKEKGATNNLLICSTDGLSRMVIENYFAGASDYFQFKFGDNQALTIAQSKALAPTTVAVGITGDDITTAPASTATTLTGGTGDDTLTGGTKNDTLDGGVGNDILKGGLGSDVFIFAKNGGKDRVLFESSYYTSDMDTIRFTDVVLSELSFSTEQSTDGLPHLLIESQDGTQMIVENYFNSGIRDRIRFQFGSASALTAAQTQLLTMCPVNTGGSGDDTLRNTYYTGGILNGNEGNDTLYGGNYNDYLNGDDGDDNIIGYDGDDIIDGGAGNDTLMGAYGNDTYVFTRNGGMDTVKDDSPGQSTSVETIWFKDVTLEEVVFKPDQYWLNTLHIETLDGSTRMTIQNYYNNSLDRYRFKFGSDESLSLSESQSIALSAVVIGTEKDDHLQAVLSTGNTLFGKGGNDWIFGSDTVDTLDGGAGNDDIKGYAGNDRLIGGIGDDLLEGGAGADTYVFNRGDGQDVILLTDSEDVLELGEGIEIGDLAVVLDEGKLQIQIAGTDDRMTLNGWDTGNKLAKVKLANGTELSVVQLEAMNFVKTIGTDGNDVLIGEDLINDYIIGNGGDDRIEGKSGSDRIVGGEGVDTYVFSLGDGQDTYTLSGIEDKLELGTGIEQSSLKGTLNAGGDYVMTVGAGTDTLTFKNWNGGNKLSSLKLTDADIVLTTAQLEELAGIVNGTAESDTLTATQAIDYAINGGAGIDMITGNAGNDTLTGGTGNDIIAGGAGVDTYKFNLGDGQDMYTLAGIEDKLELGTGIAQGSLKGLINESGDYVLTIGAGTDTLTFMNWNGGNKLSSLKLTEGNIMLTTVQLEELAGIINGTAGNDTLIATQAIDYVISGGAGVDTIAGNTGNDTLTGGAGNDIITGGNGVDTYKFNLGDGQDTYTLSGIEDKLELGTGIEQSSLKGTLNAGGDYVMTVGTGTDTLTFKNWNGGNKLWSLKLTDGDIVLTTAQLEELAGIVNGTAGSDTLTATQAIDYAINGGAGIDTITGNAGNDIITGGTGNDIITGGAGVDTYKFNLGDGQDTYILAGIEDKLELGTGIAQGSLKGLINESGDYVLTIGAATDTLTFMNWNGGNKLLSLKFTDDNTVLTTAQLEELTGVLNGTTGNDTITATLAIDYTINGNAGVDMITGNAGNDTITGGTGNDIITGGAGIDTYIFNLGDGLDTYKPTGVEDRLKLGAGITLADLNGSVNTSGHYVLTVRDTANKLTFNNWNGGNKLAAIELANGTVLNTTQIEALKHIDKVGSSRANTLKGSSTTAVREHLQGLAGNDTLYGYGGDDFLDGGAGNDTLYGGAGNDIYIHTGAFGLDTINNSTSVAADYDMASFGYDYSKLVISRSSNDLKIKIAGQTDTATIKNWYLGGLNQIDEIGTVDSHKLLGGQVNQLIQAMATFTTQTGFTWEQAAREDNQQYIELIGSFYQG